MNGRIFDTLTRAAHANSAGVSGAKKKNGKDCKKKERQRCSSDAAACKAFVPVACEGSADCIIAATLCCEECSADGFLTCLLAATPSAAARFQ
jgi:hypothetical protein